MVLRSSLQAVYQLAMSCSGRTGRDAYGSHPLALKLITHDACGSCSLICRNTSKGSPSQSVCNAYMCRPGVDLMGAVARCTEGSSCNALRGCCIYIMNIEGKPPLDGTLMSWTGM